MILFRKIGWLFVAYILVFRSFAADPQSISKRYASTGGLPSGGIMMMLGSCPAGYTELSSLNAKTLVGTLAANGNVGTTGGSDNVTPAGSVTAPTFTGTSNQATSAVSGGTPAGTNSAVLFTPVGVITWPASVPTNGTVNFTPAGTVGTPTFSGTPATLTGSVSAPVFTGSALATHAHELPFQIPSTTTTRQIAVATFGTGTSRAATAVSTTGTSNTTSAAVALSQAVSAGTPAGTNSAPTLSMNSYTPAGTNSTPSFTGTPGTVPAQTISWPVAVPAFAGTQGSVGAPVFTGSALGTHSHTLTPAGTNSTPSFTGTQFDNRSAFVRVIFCQAV